MRSLIVASWETRLEAGLSGLTPSVSRKGVRLRLAVWRLEPIRVLMRRSSVLRICLVPPYSDCAADKVSMRKRSVSAARPERPDWLLMMALAMMVISMTLTAATTTLMTVGSFQSLYLTG